MAKLKDLAIRGAGDQHLFPIDDIQEKPGYNVRSMDSEETQSHIRRMADSIKETGTEAFPAITIFQEDNIVFVRAGHCRLRAHKLARDEGAPVIGIRAIAAPKHDAAQQVMDLLNSNDGLPLTPIEKAKAIKRLISFQWTATEIARQRGCSAQTIMNSLALLDAPAEAVRLVEEGKVSVTLAMQTVRQSGALMGTQKLKDGVDKATAAGKTKATAKHVAEKGVNWSVWGPKMKAMLEEIRDADSNEELQSVICKSADMLRQII